MILVWLAAAFIGGIFLGFGAAVPPAILLAGAIGASGVAIWRWQSHRLRLGALILCCFFLGAGRAQQSQVHIGRGDVAYYNGQTVTLIGYVNSEPDNRDTGNNYVITVQDRVLSDRNLPLRGQLELHTAASQLFDEGDDLEVTGILTTPANSPGIPYGSILANRGIYSEMAFPKGFVIGHVSLGLVGFADSIREEIENTITASLPEPEATFLIALLIGAKSAQLGALAPVLIETGLIHLIAISGIKIAIVAGTVNDFLRLVASRTPRLLLSATILFSYWLVSGATVAGLRASLMWMLIFLAAYLGRPTFALVSLGLAASIMLAFNPALLWDTGFQFTVLATASISVFSPAFDRWLRWMPSALRASAATTAAAQFAVLPIQIASFHVLSPISLLANAVVLPFVPLTMVVGFGAVLAPGSILTTIAYGLVHMMIAIARWAAGLAPAFVLNSLPSPVSLAYYVLLSVAAVAAWKFARFDRSTARGEWLFGFAVAAVGLGVVLSAPATKNEITFPVDGSVLITWHDSAVLIDGGTRPSVLLTALGEALPYPDDTLAAVIDTSPSARNVAALTAEAQNLKVGEAFDPGLEYPTQTYARWRQSLDNRHIPILALRAGTSVRLVGLSIQCLAPDAVYSDPKDGAGILLISVEGRRILYLGEASPTEQQNLVFTGQDVRAGTIISAVPIQETLARASGYRTLVQPMAGTTIRLSS